MSYLITVQIYTCIMEWLTAQVYLSHNYSKIRPNVTILSSKILINLAINDHPCLAMSANSVLYQCTNITLTHCWLHTLLSPQEGNSEILASFPGPAQLSSLLVRQVTESWAGPGNEASEIHLTGRYICVCMQFLHAKTGLNSEYALINKQHSTVLQHAKMTSVFSCCHLVKT